MFSQKLISLSASILITAGSIGALAAVSNAALPTTASTTIDGLPVTNLPGITVHPDTVPSVRKPETDSVAVIAIEARHGSGLAS